MYCIHYIIHSIPIHDIILDTSLQLNTQCDEIFF